MHFFPLTFVFGVRLFVNHHGGGILANTDTDEIVVVIRWWVRVGGEDGSSFRVEEGLSSFFVLLENECTPFFEDEEIIGIVLGLHVEIL